MFSCFILRKLTEILDTNFGHMSVFMLCFPIIKNQTHYILRGEALGKNSLQRQIKIDFDDTPTTHFSNDVKKEH